jgi:protein involved in polysaccharide export with SLBB domain
MILRIILVLLGITLVPDGLLAQSPTGPTTNSALIQPGDAVRITVWQRPEMSGEFTVSREGRLIHPLYRAIDISGLDGPALEAEVRRYLERFEATPSFVVEPLFRIVVEGAVRQPGRVSVPPGTSVRDAIVEAGGVSEMGLQNRARLTRGGAVRSIALDDADQSRLEVRSGDEIVVPRRRSIFRDYVAPVSSFVGAMGSIATLIWRARR